METVFTNVVLEKGVKSYMLLGGLLAKGPVCPFLGNFILKTVTGSFLHPYVQNNMLRD